MILTNSVTINAPPPVVWQILTDFAHYPEWNPFTPTVDCSGVVGEPVTLQAQVSKNGRLRTVSLYLTRWQPHEAVCWGADAWYLRVNRCQTLSPLPEGQTQYTNSESFTGLLAPLVIWTQRHNLMRGYRLAAAALKKEAER